MQSPLWSGPWWSILKNEVKDFHTEASEMPLWQQRKQRSQEMIFEWRGKKDSVWIQDGEGTVGKEIKREGRTYKQGWSLNAPVDCVVPESGPQKTTKSPDPMQKPRVLFITIPAC